MRVERRFTHPLFKKTVRRSKKYYAHDEKNEFKVGDMVWIEEHARFPSSSAGPLCAAKRNKRRKRLRPE